MKYIKVDEEWLKDVPEEFFTDIYVLEGEDDEGHHFEIGFVPENLYNTLNGTVKLDISLN